MAAASLAPPNHNHHHHRRHLRNLSNSSPSSSTSWFLSRKLPHSSSLWASIELSRTIRGPLTNCSPFTSPSPTSPEISPGISEPTAESCINLGLSLFSKGRVLTYNLSSYYNFLFLLSSLWLNWEKIIYN